MLFALWIQLLQKRMDLKQIATERIFKRHLSGIKELLENGNPDRSESEWIEIIQYLYHLDQAKVYKKDIIEEWQVQINKTIKDKISLREDILL